MIRGIVGVVKASEMETGRFYLAASYGEQPSLLMAAETPDAAGRLTKSVVTIPIDGEAKFEISFLRDPDLVVALPEVSVRVDAPSLIGTIYTMRLSAGVFAVVGEEPFIVASTGRWGAGYSVSLTTGKTLLDGVPEFVAFSRWSLVIDDAATGQEVAIASFGQENQ